MSLYVWPAEHGSQNELQSPGAPVAVPMRAARVDREIGRPTPESDEQRPIIGGHRRSQDRAQDVGRAHRRPQPGGQDTAESLPSRGIHPHDFTKSLSSSRSIQGPS
jgi:hypothetical protein